MRYHEAHVERLLGRRVHDEHGRKIGRIEEMIVEVVDGEYVVTEFHIGSGAFLERIAGFVVQLPFFKLLPFATHQLRLTWRELDLTDPVRPVRRQADSRAN